MLVDSPDIVEHTVGGHAMTLQKSFDQVSRFMFFPAKGRNPDQVPEQFNSLCMQCLVWHG
jgi:hypothetical protein